MEEGLKEPIQKGTNNNNNNNNNSNKVSIGDQAFKSVGDLIKLLPSGTVFVFQFLSPLLTNTGHCNTLNKVLSSLLLLGCGFSCSFASFTDSYVGRDGRLYYGIVTRSGLWSFSDPNARSLDLSKYRLRAGDFVHALLALVVFAAIALLDADTVACFYPALEKEESAMVGVLPAVVGGLASFVFMVFPNNRHGIGYPPTQPTENFSSS
ncbi:uncharacterized protein LOC109723829 [Ananas comosus]|uniref:Uncharacterized protein LOC109723829 n=1 Tax=Ananas comosus TaxID=4615 RepID=A0A6P5GJG3_ANACO|nr:uncharacterized protein LOC109723829 [Ananas comosus]